MGCPGYIKFDVLRDGKPVPGGNDLEIAYTGRIMGMFNDWPNFSLHDVMEMTDMSDHDIDWAISEAGPKESEEKRRMHGRVQTFSLRYDASHEKRRKCRQRLKGLQQL